MAETVKKTVIQDVRVKAEGLLDTLSQVEELAAKLKEPIALLKKLEKQSESEEKGIIEAMKELKLTAIDVKDTVMSLLQKKAFKIVQPEYKGLYKKAMEFLEVLDSESHKLVKNAEELEIKVKADKLKDYLSFVKEASGEDSKGKGIINRVLAKVRMLWASLGNIKTKASEFKKFVNSIPESDSALATTTESTKIRTTRRVVEEVASGRSSITEAVDKVIGGTRASQSRRMTQNRPGRLVEEQYRAVIKKIDLDDLAKKLRKNKSSASAVVNVVSDFFKQVIPKFDGDRFLRLASMKDADVKE